MKRSVEKIFARPPRFNMVGDGFRVYNYFPNGGGVTQRRISPFLMLDFGPAFDFGPSDTPRGVDVHPHKGFETVTIAYKGSVAHNDSAGNAGVIKPGDVQWMTAGAGILHKEYHETEFSKKGGEFEMVQLWVNLPAKDKLTAPKYQEITADKMGKVELANGVGIVNVIAGSFNGSNGPATTFTAVNMFDIKLNKGGEVDFSLPATQNAAILVVEGSAEVNGENAATHSFVLFKNNDGEDVHIKTSEGAVLLVLSGDPIDEPIAQYGPFVMNTQQELYTAFEEFQSGKFGHLS